MKKLILVVMALSVMLMAVEVMAKPLISVSMKAEQEIIVNNQAKRIAIDKVASEDVVVYTISYVNSGNEAATNAVLDDPIPRGTVYVNGSAFGNDADVTFSIDGGKTFKKPSLLTYEIKMPNGKVEKKTASPEQYTDIRWTISKVPAGGKGQVGFKVKVK